MQPLDADDAYVAMLVEARDPVVGVVNNVAHLVEMQAAIARHDYAGARTADKVLRRKPTAHPIAMDGSSYPPSDTLEPPRRP